MIWSVRITGLLVLLGSAISVYAAGSSSTTDATITSDELEMLDNGARTIFRGHVVLTQEPDVLLADRMIRTRLTEVVEADGHIHGTWKSEKGEICVATGTNARYNPSERTTELWGNALVTEWQSPSDTQPVIMAADHFAAHETSTTVSSVIVDAEGNVHITWFGDNGAKSIAVGSGGRYNRAAETIELWGRGEPAQVTHWQTAADTQPVVVTANRFIVYRQDRTLLAKGDVHMQQPHGIRTVSDEGKYEQAAKVVTLWGQKPVLVHWEDAKGMTDFESERAWLLVSPKKVKLINNVHGHVIPAS